MRYWFTILMLALLAPAGTTGAEGTAMATEGTPLSELGYPACGDILVPDAAIEERGGGRTVADYVAICTGTEEASGDEDAASERSGPDAGGTFLTGTGLLIATLAGMARRVGKQDWP